MHGPRVAAIRPVSAAVGRTQQSLAIQDPRESIDAWEQGRLAKRPALSRYGASAIFTEPGLLLECDVEGRGTAHCGDRDRAAPKPAAAQRQPTNTMENRSADQSPSRQAIVQPPLFVPFPDVFSSGGSRHALDDVPVQVFSARHGPEPWRAPSPREYNGHSETQDFFVPPRCETVTLRTLHKRDETVASPSSRQT